MKTLTVPGWDSARVPETLLGHWSGLLVSSLQDPCPGWGLTSLL